MNENQKPQGPLGPTDGQIARMRGNIRGAIAAEQTRGHRRRGWTVGGTLGLLVVLAGGTSAAMAAGVLQAPAWFIAAPAPAPTHTPAAATTPSATPTPTPTPTATAAAPEGQHDGKPTTRIAVSCADVLPEATVSSLIGKDALLGLGYGGDNLSLYSVPQLLSTNAALTPGALDCDWGSSSEDASLLVTITPLDAFDPSVLDGPAHDRAQLAPDPDLGAGATVWGDDDGDAIVFVPVNGEMLEVFATEGGGPIGASINPTTNAESAARTALQQLKSAPAPLPPYSSEGSLSTDCQTFAQAITAKPGTGVLRAAGSSPSLLSDPFTYPGGLDCLYTHTAVDGTDPVPVGVYYLPGGAWDWGQAQEAAFNHLKLTTLPGLGDDALVGCSPTNDPSFGAPFCEVDVKLDNSWLDVKVTTSDQATAVDIAKSITDEIAELAG